MQKREDKVAMCHTNSIQENKFCRKKAHYFKCIYLYAFIKDTLDIKFL